MNIKKYLCFFAIIFLSPTFKAKAQTSVGFNGGVTYSKLDFKPNNSKLTLAGRQGYILNLNLYHHLNKWLFIEASAGQLQKNYTIKNAKNIYQDIDNTYLQLPVSVGGKLQITKKLSGLSSLGMYYAYWMTSKINGVAPNVFELSTNSAEEEFIKIERIKVDHTFAEQDKRSEYGWSAKVGLDYRIIGNFSCSVKAHYYQSITSQQKQVTPLEARKYNETFALTLGACYSFKIGK